MSVYTRRGDQGETSLFGGKHVLKADLQVECYGTVDEASSCLGLARGLIKNVAIQELIVVIQKKLQTLSSELACTPERLTRLKERIGQDDILQLENQIDSFSEMIPKKSEFVLPGGTVSSGCLDFARTIIRRAERLVVALKQQQDVSPEILQYMNRLSDLLYVLARVADGEELVQLVRDRVMEQLDVPVFKGLTPIVARKLVETAEDKAKQIGLAIVCSVADSSGNLLLLERQPEAILASVDIARGKAYTAAVTSMPTHTLADLCQPGQPLYGIENTNEGRLVVFGGGFPLTKDAKLYGAVGVSGGSVEQDMEVALAAVSFWEKYTRG